MNSVARPTGITILAILALIGGIFGALAGLALLFGGALIGGAIGGAEGVAFGGFAFILGLITLAGAGLTAFSYADGSCGIARLTRFCTCTCAMSGSVSSEK